jgi:CHAD domain-containing protein
MMDMAKTDQPTFPLCAYLDEIVAELRKEVPAALDDHEHEAIHKARVATRRLKAALDLLKPVLSPGHRKNFAKVLMKLRDRLGKERDLDVMLRHLDERANNDSLTSASKWAAETIRKKRDKTRDKNDAKTGRAEMLRRLGAWSDIRAEMSECGEAILSLLGESLHLQLEAFAERAARMNEGIAGDQIHQLRLAGKRLRYTLEMAEKSGHPLPEGVMPAFKQMQDDLGGWHDYVVLTHRIIKASAKKCLPQQDMILQDEVMRLATDTLGRARRQLGEFSRLWSERGAEIADAIRSTFPLTHPQAPQQDAVLPGDSGNAALPQ